MYLISYDLSTDRLRQKVARELENFGRRVQYSVFECRISASQLRVLYQRLAGIMEDETQGSIRIYSICANCEGKLQMIGVKETDAPGKDEEDFFLV